MRSLVCPEVLGHGLLRRVRFVLRMRPRLDDQRPLLLLPGPHGGSVEHFYHFLLGYFAPVVLWMGGQPSTSVLVRSCGPLDAWFGLLPERHRHEVIPPGVMLRRFLHTDTRHVILPAFDDPAQFPLRAIRSFAAAMKRRTAAMNGDEGPEILILDRSHADPFYTTPGTERRGAGPTRRSVPNMRGIAEHLGRLGSIGFSDPSTLLPLEQIALCRDARVLVAQHGAALTHMVWMEPGATIVELHPAPERTRPFFERLATVCGHRYVMVRQSGPHDDVEPERVRRAIREVEADL